MKKRVIILLAVVASFALAVIAFPDVPNMEPSRLAKHLPAKVGEWRGQSIEPGEREKAVLAKDTEFERMRYFEPGSSKVPVEVSIVFSGKNLSQSIHRPEVCLAAQGWKFVKQKYYRFEGLLPNNEIMPVKEMICSRVLMKNGVDGKPEPETLPDGSPKTIWRAFYYTFFGHDRIMAGHYQRTGEDIKDRLLKGYDQRWAYATFSAFITGKHSEQGFSVYGQQLDQLNEEQTRTHVQKFLKQLLPIVVSPPGEGYDESLASGKNLGS